MSERDISFPDFLDFDQLSETPKNTKTIKICKGNRRKEEVPEMSKDETDRPAEGAWNAAKAIRVRRRAAVY